MRAIKKSIPIVTLIGTDIIAIVLAFLFAYFSRLKILPVISRGLPRPLPFSQLTNYWFLILLWPIVFAYEGLYTRKYPTEEETLQIWKGTAIAGLISIFILFYVRGFLVSRAIIILALLFIGIFVPLFRRIAKNILNRLGLWTTKAIIIGNDDAIMSLIKYLNKNPEIGYTVVEHIRVSKGENPTNLIKNIEMNLKKHGRCALFISGYELKTTFLPILAERLKGHVEEIVYVPNLEGLRVANLQVEHMGAGVVMKLKTPLLTRPNLLIKRTFDLISSIILLILTLPLFLIIAIAIKLDSKGPIFFVQRRIGKGGKIFSCYKFRTMFLDADRRLKEVLDNDENARIEWQTHKKLSRDPRVTRIGRILRRFSLDELPQLLNVLFGQMSLVGPRPYLEEELPDLSRDIKIITSVKPGLTGLWQVSGRSNLSFRERAVLDEYYVRNWSLWLDFIILLKTIGVILKGDGAY